MSIRSAREKAGLTVLDVAYKMEVSPTAIYFWENGTYQPRGKRLLALAQLYDTTVDDLLRPDEKGEPHA